MSDSLSRLSDRAGELRLAFDSAFAQEARRDSTPMEDLLAFQVGSERYTLRLSEIAGLYADRKVTRVPGGVPSLLGVAGFRGYLVPVYDLHLLLGRAPIETPHWLVVASAAQVAFAFETFDVHLRVSRDAILPERAGKKPRRLILEFATIEGLARPIVSLPAALEAIQALQPRTPTPQER